MRQLILPFCHRCVDVGQMTGCSWRQHGVGGTLDTTQFLCLLATNIANEKVFIFLWFWYIALFLITLVNIGYYCILLFSKDVKWRDRFIDISVRSTRSRTTQTARTDYYFLKLLLWMGAVGGSVAILKYLEHSPR